MANKSIPGSSNHPKVVKALSFVGALIAAVALYANGAQTEAIGLVFASLSSAGILETR